MKNILAILLISTMFISCSSDDNTDMQNDLVGTKWKGRHASGEAVSYYIYSFKSNGECEAEFSSFEDFKNSAKGKRIYEYKNNTLVIKSLTDQALAIGEVDLENGKIYFQDRYSISTFNKIN